MKQEGKWTDQDQTHNRLKKATSLLACEPDMVILKRESDGNKALGVNHRLREAAPVKSVRLNSQHSA